MRRLRSNKKGITSLQIVIACLAYYAVMFIIFQFLPASVGVSAASSGIDEAIITNDPNTTVENSPQSTNAFVTLARLATFDINNIPTWLRLIAVIVPAIILGFGVYGLIRGI